MKVETLKLQGQTFRLFGQYVSIFFLGIISFFRQEKAFSASL
ncbi:hypothetical protein C900_01306 [Fulvivirga imtechensis AK7]|uniref:Uncharacterized protein n=1 Tax=Fulvivirga imtechensis AK7 TaxID=1237149 RepID=L8JWE8_9BACT|nr:hypothetical protein C900_01306 [Fulvivirga imtechensis AK7]